MITKLKNNNDQWPHRVPVFVYAIVASLMCTGCAVRSYHPLPQHLEAEVQMPHMANVRSWGEIPSKSLEQSAIESMKQEMAANNGVLKPEMNVLTLSGGGGFLRKGC